VRAVAGSLSAEPDGIALDVSASYDPAKLSEETRAQVAAPDAPNRLLQMVPADALAVYGLKHLDLAVDSFVTQLEQTDPRAVQEITKAGFAGDGGLVSHLTGDLAFEAGPKASGAGVGGALMVGVDDADAARRAIESLTTMAYGSVQATAEGMASSGPLVSPDEWKPTWKAADYRGIEIRTLTLPYDGGSGISYAIFDGAAVIGASADDVRHVIDTAQDGPAFDLAASLGSVPTSDGFLYLDPAGIGKAIRAALPPEGQATYDKEVKPKLDPVQAVEFGAESDETHTHIRFFVSIP
jgi:hypothetical protein